MRRLLVALGITASLSATACSFVPAATAYETTDRNPRPGADYCSRLAERAGSVSSVESTTGWLVLSTAVGGGVAGTLMTSANAASDKPNVHVGITGAALTAGSAILIPVALAFFSRSDAAATLAQQGNDALSEQDDRTAYNRCVAAKGAWEVSRRDSTKIAQASLEKKSESDKEKINELEDQLEAVQSSSEKNPASDKENIEKPEDK